MNKKISMLKNPQSLIPLEDQFSEINYSSDTNILDAIFIPYKNNNDNIKSLLIDLNWYAGNIFLMPSSLDDLEDINFSTTSNIKILQINNVEFNNFFNNLESSKHKLAVLDKYNWDLPVKRNFAMWFSIKKKFRNILLIDDDIIGIDSNKIERSIRLLGKYLVVGSFVENFSDTSVIGHCEISQGINIKCFLSGSFLFISSFCVNSFFPKLYNEDWIFMVPLLYEKNICSHGYINQKEYDPFSMPEKAAFQENGEIIAEGLFALLGENSYNLRYDKNIWQEILKKRKNDLIRLQKIVKCEKKKIIINIALEENVKVTSTDCTSYLRSLDNDRLSWKLFIEENM